MKMQRVIQAGQGSSVGSTMYSSSAQHNPYGLAFFLPSSLLKKALSIIGERSVTICISQGFRHVRSCQNCKPLCRVRYEIGQR